MTGPQVFDDAAAGPEYWVEVGGDVAGSAAVPIAATRSYEDGYAIERRTTPSGSWGYLASVARDVTTFSDVTVAPTTTYEYRLYATNVLGASPRSNTRTVTTPTIPPPPMPTGLVAQPLNRSSILITWSNITQELGYRLERRTEDTNSWSVVATLVSNTTSYVETGLVEGTQYWFRVQAFNQSGNSPYSNEGSAAPANLLVLLEDDFDPAHDPLVWANISAGVATNGGQGFRAGQALYFGGTGLRSATTIPVNVSLGGYLDFSFRAGNQAVDGNTFWNNCEANEPVILEYSKDNGSNWVIIVFLNTLYPAASDWTRHLIPLPTGAYSAGTMFRWRQLSHSGPAQDCWALEDFALQGRPTEPPGGIPFVISNPSSSTSIGLYWASPSGAASFVVERKFGVEPWIPVATNSVLQTYYTDTGLIPGTSYVYRVKAVNASGGGPYSSTTSSYTWSQIQQWSYDNFENPEVMDKVAMTTPGADDSLPLLRFAFNLDAFEPMRPLTESATVGYPSIWFEPTTQRLTIEFVRRKSGMNPGILYHIMFGSDLVNWASMDNPVSSQPIDPTWERVRFEDTTTGSSQRFGRVGVSLK